MFWGFFSKKQTNVKETDEIIEITDENGDKTKVNKKDWLDNEVFPYLRANENNVLRQCDMLEMAIDYGVSVEVVKECINLYEENKNNQKCVSLLFKCYMSNAMYNEAIEIYEEYANNNGLATYMYYDLALAYEKINKVDEVEKNLFFAFTSNNNYRKAIDKLISYMKLNTKTEEEYYMWLKNLTKGSKSFYLYAELANLEYSMNNDEDGTKYIIRSLELNPNDEKNMVKVANILKDKKRYTDYENNIITRYIPEKNSMDMHISVLDFYVQDNQYEKGLELLKILYANEIYNDNFVKYEKIFLFSKLRDEDYEKYEMMLHGKSLGKKKSLIIEGPINSLVFKKNKEERTGKKMLILPFTVNSEYRLPEPINDFIKNIHLFLNERIYLKTNMNNKAFLLYDNLGSVCIKQKYTDEYYKTIKETNKDLDMILTGEIDVLDKKGVFDLKIHTYDLNNNQRIERFRAKTSSEVYDQVINKFLNSCLKVICDCNTYDSDIKDRKFMQYYSDYMNIVLFINNQNQYRIYQTDRILRYCLETSDENKLNMALSLIYIQAKYLSIIKERYKQKIYDEILKISDNKNLFKKFNLIYGTSENDEV